MDTRIDNGLVWIGDRLEKLTILIEGGVIHSLAIPSESNQIEAVNTIDADGMWILPGGIDLHVHISDGAETFIPGSKCAAAGGITTVMDMSPFHGCVTPQQYNLKMQQANADCVVDFGLVAGIVVTSDDLPQLGELAELGVSYFKVFMPGDPPVNSQLLWEAVKTAARTGLRLGLHAEDIACIDPEVDWRDPLGFARSRPYVAESSAAAQVAEMARAAGAPVHICHVSAAHTADVIADAKARSVDITAEVPPHFLLLDESEFTRQGARVKTTPPLRTKRDNELLWTALQEGVIDALACDHFLGSLEPAPKDPQKMGTAAAGISSLELSLPLLFSVGVKGGRVSLERFVQVTSENPARIGGIFNRKGTILPGKDADLVLWDPERVWKVSEQGDFSHNEGSPYLDWELSGRVFQTFVRGQPVWRDGEIVAPDGWGIHQPSVHLAGVKA